MRDVKTASTVPAQGLRFAVAGGAVALLYLAVTIGLADGLGVPFQVALVLGFGSAIATHFLLQRVFVWVHQVEFALPVHHQAARFLVVAAFQYAATALATAILPGVLGVSVTVVYVATAFAISAFNFFVFRTRVFHAEPDATEQWSVADIDLARVEAVDLRGTGEWPKRLPELTDEQTQTRDAFMARWLEVLPSRYGLIERFNHRYPLQGATAGRTLEIGAGLGEHLRYEDLTTQEYYVVELRDELARVLQETHPEVTAIVADCQERLPFETGSFDRVLAIHVLEHLTDLPRALDEIVRVLAPAGVFHAVIPCEGGLAYSLARRISAQRIFEREFGTGYEWLIRSEHVNVPWEILMELRKRFRVVGSRYFPFRVPSISFNLVIGLTLRPLEACKNASVSASARGVPIS